jgi:hypothetical protein
MYVILGMMITGYNEPDPDKAATLTGQQEGSDGLKHNNWRSCHIQPDNPILFFV